MSLGADMDLEAMIEKCIYGYGPDVDSIEKYLEIDFLVKHKLWRTKGGDLIDIKKMDARHLENCIKLLEKKDLRSTSMKRLKQMLREEKKRRNTLYKSRMKRSRESWLKVKGI